MPFPEQVRMSDEIPSDPTLAATVARTSWGQYGATLTLPNGQEHVFAGADLDSIRTRVLEDARSYLASHVGHPGRLEVTDPGGTWLLGIPHDGGDLIAISSASACATPPALEPAAALPVSAPTARTVLLPSRPAIPSRRRRPRRGAQRHGHWSVSDRRLAVLALLAAVILALVLVEALDHNGPVSTAAKYTRTANQKAAARSSSQPATVSRPKPPVKSAPQIRPARHKPTTPKVARRHKTAAPKTRRAAQEASHHRAAATHHPTASSSAPAVTSTATAPVVTATPPVQAPASRAPTHTARTAPLPSPSGPPPL
jgi:hypothetical protein